MSKTIVGIFAHPDDESLGPSGTIAKLAAENDFYLICVTNGDATFGKPDKELAKVRKEELEESSKILGVKKVFFLDYGDGTLSNSIYHEVAGKIQEILDTLKPEMILTIEPRGVSGHLDHIAVSMISSFLFERLQYVKEIWYHCWSTEMSGMVKDYFIYFPPGYSKEEVDTVINVSDVWEQKKSAILQHQSQKQDIDAVLARESVLPKEEYFLIRKK